ncbi:MAG: hypothetical protein WCJ42_12750 [Actinomycetes bacterium]
MAATPSGATPRRDQPVREDAIVAFKQIRPNVEVAISQTGDKGPPQMKK